LETLFTGPFNVTGDPAIVLPCGYADGLPVGLQLAAAGGTNQELLRTAAAVEEMLGFINPFVTRVVAVSRVARSSGVRQR
jgi:aspartyl-tRNA(Asn)/glutamyl-tRNA(Gln) amidotransferase subunit A